ncbi:MAG: TasA family protein [Patescibacteria group bacterium]|jgi:predicted ribosomally synthesized peptide with SipW-like signal peptide
MKKILMSLSIIAAVGAVVVTATTAYFSDTETSTGNTFTAGTIDIAIDGENPVTKHFNIGDLKPGETGNMTFKVKNVGTNPANISKSLYNFTKNDSGETYLCPGAANTSSEPECVAEAGTPKDDVETQLYYGLEVKVYADDGEITPIWWQTIYNVDPFNTLATVYGAHLFVKLGVVPPLGHMTVTQAYKLNPDADNKYQGDGLKFDMDIKADQLAQGADGNATVTLENKTGDPEYAVIVDTYQGVLTYKTTNPTFNFSFTGTAPTSANYTLVVGDNPWTNPTGACVLGDHAFSGSTTFSGDVTCPTSLTNAKAWLVLTSDWNNGSWAGWNQASYLLETGLVNYTKN